MTRLIKNNGSEPINIVDGKIVVLHPGEESYLTFPMSIGIIGGGGLGTPYYYYRYQYNRE